ncbi:MAG: hypothetical protein ACRC8W_04730 [Plesiomonas shigelloides]
MSNQIKNGDLPAMPLTGDAYEDLSGRIHKGYGYNPECLGMTKREMMAINAPDTPEWFERLWRENNIGVKEYFYECLDEWGAETTVQTVSGISAMYFAWRTHFADSLLSELEKTKC